MSYNYLTNQEYTSSNNKKIKYRLYVPNDADTSEYPMFIWMHGYGERGDDNELQLIYAYGEYVERVKNLYDGKVIILAPQCPAGDDCWYTNIDDRLFDASNFKVQDSLNCVKELILSLKSKFNIKKISIAGFSMGGGGSIQLALMMPNVFCKVIAMGPGVVPNKGDVSVFKKTKLILTCAYGDNIIQSKNTRVFMNYLCDQNIPFSFYQAGNGDHFEAFIYAATSKETILHLFDDVRY